MARTAVVYGFALIACSGASPPTQEAPARSEAGVSAAQQPPVSTAAAQPASAGSASGAAGNASNGMKAAVGGTAAPAVSNAGGAGNAGAGAGGAAQTPAMMAGSNAPATAGTSAGAPSTPDDDNCAVGKYTGTAAKPLTLSGNTGAHDPTLIEANGTYYRFWTGDRIPVATSTDLMSWRDAQPVYKNGYPMWSKDWLAGVSGQTFNFPWAPDVSHFGDAYHLYSTFSAKFGDNISCITHLTSSDVAANDWTDHGPVICTKGSEKYNAIDADVGLDLDGTPYLSFGSFWDGIFAFKLNDKGERVGSDLTRLAWAREIEAPVMFHRCGYHYLLVSWGLCCPGNNRSVDQLTYKVVVGRSKNILGPYVDRKGVNMVEGGGSIIVQGDSTFAAAGHSDVMLSKGHFYHLYHAYRRPSGRAELRVVELLFDDEGWPVATPP